MHYCWEGFENEELRKMGGKGAGPRDESSRFLANRKSGRWDGVTHKAPKDNDRGATVKSGGGPAAQFNDLEKSTRRKLLNSESFRNQ